MARGDVRIAVTLACEECKRRNYQTNKSKRNNPDRISLRKYCKWCRRTRGIARRASEAAAWLVIASGAGAAPRARPAAGTMSPATSAWDRTTTRSNRPWARAPRRPTRCATPPPTWTRRASPRPAPRRLPSATTTTTARAIYDDEIYGDDDVERAPDEVQGDAVMRRRAGHVETEEHRRSRGRLLTFFGHCIDELRRVQWPNRRQVGQATAVVLGFVVIAGGYLGLLDQLWQPLIEAIL